MWRINKASYHLQGLFIACASINSIYCILWDIFNDWSLSPRALRRTLVYRKHKWWYYAAMVEDTLLRFLWLGYVVFPHDTQAQHSSIISFMIAILEIGRRGIWVIFRVENEHCANVEKNRAVKDTDLPYPMAFDGASSPTRPDQVAERIDGLVQTPEEEATATSSQLERQPSGVQSVRRRQAQAQDSPVARALKSLGSTVLSAHAQDYERRKPTAAEEAGSDDDDDDDSDRDD